MSTVSQSTSSCASGSSTIKTSGGFLPHTFLEQVDQFLENSDSEYDDSDKDDSPIDADADADTKNQNANQGDDSMVPMLVTQSSAEPCNLAETVSTSSSNNGGVQVHSQNPSYPSNKQSSEERQANNKNAPPPKPPQPLKSSLKKVSSYHGLQDLDDDKMNATTVSEMIPIYTHKSAWKTLPAPKSSSVRRVGSSPCLFPEQAPNNNNTLPMAQQPVMKRNVSFTNILVRDYPMTVGDNPSCQAGTPVGLDWTHQQQVTISVEDYEQQQQQQHGPDGGCRRRRTRAEMHLPAWHRDEILRRCGVSRGEMQHVQQQVARARRQRAATMSLLPLQPLETLIESATRKMKRLRGLGKSGSGSTSTSTSSSRKKKNATTIQRSQSANDLPGL